MTNTTSTPGHLSALVAIVYAIDDMARDAVKIVPEKNGAWRANRDDDAWLHCMARHYAALGDTLREAERQFRRSQSAQPTLTLINGGFSDD